MSPMEAKDGFYPFIYLLTSRQVGLVKVATALVKCGMAELLDSANVHEMAS